MYLRRLNFNIQGISFDQYQSVDSMQLLSKAGFKVDDISVDRTDLPYLSWREAAVQKRINMYYYEPLYNEAKQLIVYSSIKKVDHPPNGSKDVTDAGCGVHTHLMRALTADKLSQAQKTTLNMGQIERVPAQSVIEILERIKNEPPLVNMGVHTKAGNFVVKDYRK
jgi:alpha-galactosidase/6-phospho-beta-glucosidase family protein